MDNMLETNDIIFLVIWSCVGSTLGFFMLVNLHNRSLQYKIRRYILSLCTGIFVALPITCYLLENQHFSKLLSIAIGGLCAFGLPDFIFKHWSELIDKAVNKVIDNKL